jgi:glutathione peroxidase
MREACHRFAPAPLVAQNARMTAEDSFEELSFVDNRGRTVEMSEFAGRPVLIVNTASKCGFTPQYDGLQQLHEEFGPNGLVVLGFPCDQFAHQEPGSDDEIEEFCRINHGVTFPLSTKVNVNGKDTHPVFEFLKQRTSGTLGSSVKWNFTKFLVAPDGETVKRYSPTTEPKDLTEDIEGLLAAPS